MSAHLQVAFQALRKERFAAANQLETLQRTEGGAVRRPDHRAHSPVAGIEHHIARLDAVIRNVERLATAAPPNQGDRP